MLDKVGDKVVPVAEEEMPMDGPIEPLEITSAEQHIAPSPSKSSGRSAWYYIGKFLLTIIQAILMVAVLAGAFMITKTMIDEKPEPRKRRAFKTVYTVETITAKQENYQPVFTSYGQTIAARTVDLRALVSGEIVKVNPKLRAGASVAKGDALVSIDEFNYRGALAEAKANLVEAQARVIENEAQVSLENSKLEAAKEQLTFAMADLERIERLKKAKTSTQQQVEARKLVVSQRKQAVALSSDTIEVQQARLGQLKASIDRLQWRVNQAQRNLESTVLSAPFSGIIRSSTAEVGRAITANDVVVSMYQDDQLEVKFTLTDAQYGRLQADAEGLLGRVVSIVWSVGGKEWVYPAVIDRIGADIASNRGGVELFARVGDAQNAITIRPGAFVEVRVPDRVFANAIMVPDTAVYRTNTVYTAVDGKLVENEVEIAAFEGERALITSGLKPGDEVLITRITEVSAGLNVRREGEPEVRTDSLEVNKPKSIDAVGKKPKTGRPDQKEFMAIIKANKLTIEEFRALDMSKKRALIKAYREAQ